VRGERSRARQRDHQQRRADCDRDRQAEQEDEDGQDDEAAADSEEAGQHARPDAGRCGAPNRNLRDVLGLVGPPHHSVGSGEEEEREREQDGPAADQVVQGGSSDRSGRPGETEDQRGLRLDAADARVIGRTGERRRSDDEQRLRRGVLDGLAEDVDEHGYGEDRAAAAEEAEQQSDHDAEGQREQSVTQIEDHVGLRSTRSCPSIVSV
jgi:hypothetical protein